MEGVAGQSRRKKRVNCTAFSSFLSSFFPFLSFWFFFRKRLRSFFFCLKPFSSKFEKTERGEELRGEAKILIMGLRDAVF
jgi:hypothetical protein